jgi:methylated-DNA-[protein]-cysteine S-methyltransferase
MKKIDWSKYSPFQQKVYKVTMQIPAGKVMTYGQVARAIGKPGAARAVGTALSKNQDVPVIPCHRVIASDGRMGGYSGKGGINGKLKLLKKEGYTV